MICLHPLKRCDRGFESHSRHRCLCAFILCLCCSVCTCDGLIPHPRSPTDCVKDQETEEAAKVCRVIGRYIALLVRKWNPVVHCRAHKTIPSLSRDRWVHSIYNTPFNIIIPSVRVFTYLQVFRQIFYTLPISIMSATCSAYLVSLFSSP
jgi:hypothetical protein